MARASAVRRDLKLRLAAILGPEARARALAAAARSELAEVIQQGRASPTYRRTVDGRAGADESTVRGDGRGVIVYEFSYTAEAAVFALQYLVQRAPFKSGRYRDSFFVAVDGRFIPARSFNPANVPARAEIIIGNSAPDNRKADVQQVGPHRLNYNKPANMFADAARAVRRRFGNAVKAERVYDIAFPGKYRLVQAQRRLSGRQAGRVIRAKGGEVESPALIISAQ